MDACGIGVQLPTATETFLRDFQTRALGSLPYIHVSVAVGQKLQWLGSEDMLYRSLRYAAK